MEENTVKISHILFMIFMMGIIIVVGTYAWLSYRSNDTAMVLTIGEINNTQVTLSPYQIKASLLPQVTYTNDNYVTVTAINNSSSPRKVTLFYKINSIDNELISSDFKYTIERSTDGTTYTQYQTGNFSSAVNGAELTILEEKLSANTTYYYKVYLWIDGSNGGQSYIQGKSFSGELRADISSIFLPLEYQQITYLESNGTQYIKPNIQTNNDVYWYAKFSVTNLKGTYSGNYNMIVGVNSNPQIAVASDRWSVGNTGTTSPFTPSVNTIYEATMNSDGLGSLYINNQDTGLKRTGTCTPTIFSPSSVNGGTYARIYSVKYINRTNNEVIADFVPAYRRSDGVAGLYNIVNNVFYTNAGDNTFAIGNEVLPSEYQFVEYLESNGTQYINPNIATDTNIYWYTKFSITSLKGNANGSYNMIVGVNGKPQIAVASNQWSVGNAGASTPFVPSANAIYEATMNSDGLGSLYINNQDTGLKRAGTCTPTIFSPSDTNGGTYARIYSVKYINRTTEEIITNFVPAYRKSDKARGLYDTVNDVFYTNAGSGTFEIGPEI